MVAIKQVICFLSCFVIVSCSDAAEINADNYIAGGRAARPGQFPFIAGFRTLANQHICGGVIISNRWILTTAQCANGRQNQPQNHMAVVGSHTGRDGTPYNLELIRIHPRFNLRFLTNNIALLRTARDIQFVQGRITPIRLPNNDFNGEQRTAVWTAGWGLTKFPNVNNRGIPQVLQFKKAFTIPIPECRQRFLSNQRVAMVDPTLTLCTLTPDGKGTCPGDNGGPLVTEQGVCIGLVSWGIACGTPLPDVYVRIFPQLSFIYGTTGLRPIA